jgi:phosphoribosylamine--glycine ligase
VKIGILDGESGTCLSLAYRLTQEGHSVRLWIKPLPGESLAQKVGTGLVARAASPRAVADVRPDVIIAHQVPAEADALRASGFKVWGSSKTATRLEKDRTFAAKVATDAGLTVPTMRRFTNAVDAERFIAEQSREAWVFKAEGGADVPSSTTHVCRSKEELLAVLDYESRLNRAKSFVLQAKIDGVEISVEGWFDYRIGWLHPFNSTFEGKHLFGQDRGPLTGSMGSVVFPWTERIPSLVGQTLERLTSYLQGIQYLGPMDVNVIVDETDQLPKFLEFTPRIGFDAGEAFMSAFDGDFGRFCVEFGNGLAPSMHFMEPFAAVVKVMIPTANDVPVLAPWEGSHSYMPKDVWLDKAMLRSCGSWDESGFSAVFEVGDTGRTPSEAMERALCKVKEVQAPNVSYRNDIGQVAERLIQRLDAWGYDVPRPELDIASVIPTEVDRG